MLTVALESHKIAWECAINHKSQVIHPVRSAKNSGRKWEGKKKGVGIRPNTIMSLIVNVVKFWVFLKGVSILHSLPAWLKVTRSLRSGVEVTLVVANPPTHLVVNVVKFWVFLSDASILHSRKVFWRSPPTQAQFSDGIDVRVSRSGQILRLKRLWLPTRDSLQHIIIDYTLWRCLILIL